MPYLILAICLSMIVALFAVQNAVSVVLNFGIWSFSMSLVMVILGAFLGGVLAATFFILMMKARHYMADRKMREEIGSLQNENTRLKERISMLQRTQMLHAEAENKAAAAGSGAGKAEEAAEAEHVQ